MSKPRVAFDKLRQRLSRYDYSAIIPGLAVSIQLFRSVAEPPGEVAECLYRRYCFDELTTGLRIEWLSYSGWGDRGEGILRGGESHFLFLTAAALPPIIFMSNHLMLNES
ncbi:MAG: hypothetical protein V9G20_11900 [Candidatus Promineifilaceae bacterium]